MCSCEHHIGVWYEYEEAYIVTLEQLKKFEKEGSFFGDWDMNDYLNVNKDTNLIRFSYCPKCGEKIDWDNLK